MRNRLASLIVVKQEPSSNSLVTHHQNSLGSQHSPYGGELMINHHHHHRHLQSHETGEITAAASISIKSEASLYEINNNHLHQNDNFNYNTVNTNAVATAAHKILPPSPITASTTPTNLIYPCRNLFPDGCDISHHSHHNNCSNYFYNLNESPSPITPPYTTSNGDKFILKSEPLPYEHSVLDVVAAASASATDNLWCLSNLTYRKQLGSFNVSSSSPEQNIHIGNNCMYFCFVSFIFHSLVKVIHDIF